MQISFNRSRPEIFERATFDGAPRTGLSANAHLSPLDEASRRDLLVAMKSGRLGSGALAVATCFDGAQPIAGGLTRDPVIIDGEEQRPNTVFVPTPGRAPRPGDVAAPQHDQSIDAQSKINAFWESALAAVKAEGDSPIRR